MKTVLGYTHVVQVLGKWKVVRWRIDVPLGCNVCMIYGIVCLSDLSNSSALDGYSGRHRTLM